MRLDHLPDRGSQAEAYPVMPLMLVTMKAFNEYSDEFGMTILGMRPTGSAWYCTSAEVANLEISKLSLTDEKLVYDIETYLRSIRALRAAM